MQELQHIHFQQIHIVSGFNSREDYGDIEELAASIRANGLQTPLEVCETSHRAPFESGEPLKLYELTDGHRRMAALERIRQADPESPRLIGIPVLVKPADWPEEERLLRQIIKNDSKPLSFLEEAKVYGRLFGLGLSKAEIARRAGRSPTHINDSLTLLDCPAPVLERVREGKLAATQAIKLVRQFADPEEIEVRVERAITEAGDGPVKVTRSRLAKSAAPVEDTEEPPRHNGSALRGMMHWELRRLAHRWGIEHVGKTKEALVEAILEKQGGDAIPLPPVDTSKLIEKAPKPGRKKRKAPEDEDDEDELPPGIPAIVLPDAEDPLERLAALERLLYEQEDTERIDEAFGAIHVVRLFLEGSATARQVAEAFFYEQ